MHERRSELGKIYTSFLDAYDGSDTLIADLMIDYEDRSGARAHIIDNRGNIKYDSVFSRLKIPSTVFNLYEFEASIKAERELVARIIAGADTDEIERIGYSYAIVADTGRGPNKDSAENGFLCLIGLVNNKSEVLVLRIPMAFMQENSSFNSTFLLITSMFTLFICIVLAYFLSRQFTRPLIEMESVATAMADFDFTKKYTGREKNEIGNLGGSINRLSTNLEETISELKNTNESLEREIREKERVDNMRREFIINVSHELKTPLAVIQGYAEGLRLGITSDAAEQEYYCDIIEDEAQRMNRLVMQLLSLSKLELGKETPDKVMVDLYPLCSAIVEKASVLGDEKSLEIDYSGADAAIYCDYGMMEQVVTNFITNAIRYTPQNGRIKIWAESDQEGACTFYVENEGENIAEEDLPMLFEQFYRSDKARSRESGGTGIGLSIVRAIAESHGGKCGVENLPDGVRFWFWLPVPQ